MFRINYPAEIKAFHRRYISAFGDITQMQTDLDLLFRPGRFASFRSLKVEAILVAPIEALFTDCGRLKEVPLTPAEKKALKRIFNYDDASLGTTTYQSRIAAFFMDSPELNISTCFFCNIDYINSFKPIGDYLSAIDFVKQASLTELLQIKSVTEARAKIILAERNRIGSIEQLRLPQNVKDNLTERNTKDLKNQFTLDHVLDKASHPLAALSLYNFVPSCYNCNSKFKKQKALLNKDTSLSPTSKSFILSDSTRFKLFFNSTNPDDFSQISSEKDFVLNFEIDEAGKDYEGYIDLFTLRARYVFHKREAFRLLDKRKRYSDSQIREVARLTGMPEHQVKKDIFGEELFEDSGVIRSLTKLKRDIARQVGIGDII